MIYAKLEDAKAYRGIHPRLDKALEYLSDPDFLNQVGSQTQYLEGEELYVTRFTYDTVPQSEAFFESHKKYLDIHMMVDGREQVRIASPEILEQYQHTGDLFLYNGRAEQTVTLAPGQFLVVFPGDAHELKICTDKPRQVSKIVFKVRIYD